jgi:pyridoxal phosphate enzyme (YggS family)
VEGSIGERFQKTLQQIEQARQRASRSTQPVKLVVVTKGHPVTAVEQAIRAGVRTLGENYVQEGVEKILAITGVEGLEWHMIGHVQSRKANLICEHFDWMQSLDSLKLAQRLNRFAGERGRIQPVLLECNVSGEESKFGWPAWDEQKWDGLLDAFEEIAASSNLQVRGLMTMPPFFDDPETARPYFRRLRRLQEFLARRLPQADWNELSMGMSADFEVAIEEGATIVRVGTAIMGVRPN